MRVRANRSTSERRLPTDGRRASPLFLFPFSQLGRPSCGRGRFPPTSLFPSTTGRLDSCPCFICYFSFYFFTAAVNCTSLVATWLFFLFLFRMYCCLSFSQFSRKVNWEEHFHDHVDSSSRHGSLHRPVWVTTPWREDDEGKWLWNCFYYDSFRISGIKPPNLFG